MEIPYTVRSRPDTGLYNAKMGIWLFLASEVMLFGGLFSGYIFLRLKAGADPEYFWPENALVVWPGFLNTLVLIASSVTVVMAWAALKMRNWRKFQGYMGFTIFCALIFMCLKGYEYSLKFKHYGFLMKDGSRVEAHIHDRDTKYDQITEIAFDPKEGSTKFLNYLQHGSASTAGDHGAKGEEGKDGEASETGQAKAESKSEPFKFRINGGEPVLLKAWLRDNKQSDPVTLVPEGDVSIVIPTKKVTVANESELTVEDGTILKGHRLGDFFELSVDKIDMRATAVRAAQYVDEDEREAAINKAISESKAFELLGHDPGDITEEFNEKKEAQLAHFREEFPKLDEFSQLESLRLAYMMKPEKKDRGHGKKEYPHMTLQAKDVQFSSNLTPKYNTYYAIYFTLTGLHGLHVIGGAIVLGYFLFRGKKLYDENPEHMANRVEVGGLFWHFVDLVWIFLFPIMYLL